MIRRDKRQRTKRRIVFVLILLFFSTGFLFQPVLAKKIQVERTIASESVSTALEQAEANIREASPAPVTVNTSSQYLDLVNKTHPLASDYVPPDLVEVTSAAPNMNCTKLRAPAAEAFEQLVAAAAADGHTIVLRSGYRSYDTQKKLFNSYVKRDGQPAAEQYSAPPGCSEHQLGLAVDVTSPSVNYKLDYRYGSTPEGKWLAENAHRFGFIVRYLEGKQDITGYVYEPWHIRYLGSTDAATEIYQQNLALEEYLDAD